MYDVIIIGAGVVGASCARLCAQYELKTLIIEKNNDVCMEASGANSGIIHSGYDPLHGTLKAKLNVIGNKMFEKIADEIDAEFIRNGSITIATNDEEIELLHKLKENALKNGVEVYILDRAELLKKEPNISALARVGLYAPSSGIINPFELVIGLIENALDNGVELVLKEEVINIKLKDNKYIVSTNKVTYESKIVINAAGLYSDTIYNLISPNKEEIKPRSGEYFVLDHFKKPFVNHTLFLVPSQKGKGVLVTKTTHGNYLIGPSSNFVLDKESKKTNKDVLDSVLNSACLLVNDIPKKEIIRQFTGIRAYHSSNDFQIKKIGPGFISALGIQSPGLTASPAIAVKILKLVEEVMPLTPNKNFNPRRRKVIKLNNLKIEEKNELIKKDKSFGHIVCNCENISEGEVKDIINRNCGALTVKGVKKRIRPGFGKCQGGMCEASIIKILKEELKTSKLEDL